MKKQKVMVGLSGGIDSSITAYLLQKDGFEIEAVYMKMHDIIKGYNQTNIKAGQKIADFLGIKYHILDVTKQFKSNVYDYFLDSYINGITPNPCVICNKTIKFKIMFDFAIKNNCDYLATGHYAKTDGSFIYEANDKLKDQSYFLGQIDKNILKKIIFPMSKYTKKQIRQIALQIPVFATIANKKDSQEICFVQNDYTDILKLHTNIELQGDTLDENGNIIGNHKGYMHYTIGKRRGFYVHGASKPYFVKNIDAKNNTITVCQRERLATTQIKINNLNMFVDDLEFEARVKLRYRSVGIKCKTTINKTKNNATIELFSPAFGVACGQIAVFYDKNKLIGSGVIISSL
jgi:tRNA-specific 2-thiouridylase